MSLVWSDVAGGVCVVWWQGKAERLRSAHRAFGKRWERLSIMPKNGRVLAWAWRTARRSELQVGLFVACHGALGQASAFRRFSEARRMCRQGNSFVQDETGWDVLVHKIRLCQARTGVACARSCCYVDP
jgi:hypothetical protein